MINHKANQFQRWRTKIQNNQLASQISTILLQRHNWSQLLQNLNLSSKLTSPLFLHVLRRIHPNPHISLQFFHWTKTHLGFEPDLKPTSLLVKISLGSGLTQPAKPILDRLVQSYPPTVLADSMVEACQGSDSQSLCLSFLLETYGKKGLFRDGLQVFDKMRGHGFSPSISACNELLDVMQRENETRASWCFYGAMVRNGVLPNRFTWSLIARTLGKSGKPERVSRLLEMGVYSSEIYGILIGCLSKDGNFGAAFDRLREMRDRKLDPGFNTFSSILDGACRHENSEVIERTMTIMVEKELIFKDPLCEYDRLIDKLCGLFRSYAAEMFFRKAIDKKIALKDTTYKYMLRALSIEGRRERAIWMFRLISEKGVVLDGDTCKAFSRVVLKDEQREGVSDLLMEIIRKGFSLHTLDLSGFLSVLCRERKWKEAEEMLNVVLDKGLSPDTFSCCSLVEHYCSSGGLDSAMALHNKIENSDISLDVATYNALLRGLVAANRVEEAVMVFDHMRKHERLSSEGFVVVIRGLCGENELRKAMKLHDEMLKLRFKPDEATYKKLILAFK